jgi:hypothetical protein
LIKQDKEGHYILIKGEIHQKEITIINLCAPNVNAPNFIKHTLNISSTFCTCTFFSVAHGTFSNIDHILGHKASLSKYKKIKIILCILSDHNALKLELNNKNNSRKYANN